MLILWIQRSHFLRNQMRVLKITFKKWINRFWSSILKPRWRLKRRKNEIRNLNYNSKKKNKPYFLCFQIRVKVLSLWWKQFLNCSNLGFHRQKKKRKRIMKTLKKKKMRKRRKKLEREEIQLKSSTSFLTIYTNLFISDHFSLIISISMEQPLPQWLEVQIKWQSVLFQTRLSSSSQPTAL